MPFETRVFIGLGSNLGDRHTRIIAALEWISRHPAIELVCHSTLIETEPWGVTEQPKFINAVAEITTSLTPDALLEALKCAERDIGRVPCSRKWGPREIDLDILLFGNRIVDAVDLIIPHAELVRRPFVLEQILELDDEAVHPGLEMPIKQLLEKGPG